MTWEWIELVARELRKHNQVTAPARGNSLAGPAPEDDATARGRLARGAAAVDEEA